MLPTPSTSHVAYERIYEPAEDSFLLLDTLSSPTEKDFLNQRLNKSTRPDGQRPPSPLVVEIGTGSGVVLSFAHVHAEIIFGRADVLTAGVDINRYACEATRQTISVAETEQEQVGMSHGFYLGNVVGDLTNPLRNGIVDVLIFNPPYVPTPGLLALSEALAAGEQPSFEKDVMLLEMSYAGGVDGMEITTRLLDALPKVLSGRGCAYVLLCAQNKPEAVKERMRGLGKDWRAETVGSSGMKGGWEKLQIIRIWHEA